MKKNVNREKARKRKASKEKARKEKQRQAKAVKAQQHSRRLLRRMSEEHPDILQNIEFGIVTAWRDDDSIDDCVVLEALRVHRCGEESEDARVRSIVHYLEQFREMRSDCSEEMWEDCLRVVSDSVRTHSLLEPESTGYLRFASRFIF